MEPIANVSSIHRQVKVRRSFETQIRSITNDECLSDEEEEEDDMAEIDMDNIVGEGRRTRGKNIDFAKAAQENLEGEEEDDEEDDDDFEDPEDAMKD